MISIRLPAAGLTFNTLSGFFYDFLLNHPLIVTFSVGFVRLIFKKNPSLYSSVGMKIRLVTMIQAENLYAKLSVRCGCLHFLDR